MFRALKAGAALGLILGSAGCGGGARIENVALGAGQANEERRSVVSDDADRPVILMTFSGGGSRAAALAAAVLQDMAETTYTAASGSFRLTDDVRLISSVSGGSVTAAWFGLNRDARHPDGNLAELRDKFLGQNNMSDLELDAVNPITWARLAFTKYTRIEALEDLLDQKLFHDAPMKQLNQPGKPVVLLNTTDISGGYTFALSPRRMDDICSSLDDLKISTGVAASAAFPVLLSPVSFYDYSTGCAGRLRSGEWFQSDLSNPFTLHVNLEEYRDARYSNDLRHGSNAFRKIDHLYFLDGGLADNLGIRTLRSAIIAPYDSVGLLPAINDGKVNKLVVVVVNARSDPPNDLYQQNTTPGLISAVNAVISVPIDANTANSQIGLVQLLTELASAAALVDQAKFRGMQIYGVTVDFDQIPSDTPEHRQLRDVVKDIPTSWSLSQPQMQAIDAAGRLLLRSDPCYVALVKDLKARQLPGPAFSTISCTTKIQMQKRSGAGTTNR
jgi:NTE family protein